MKPKVAESRFDFRGGRNTAIAPDLLNANELVDSTNCRLVGSYGAIIKRSGTQRIHKTAFPGPIQGVAQWDGPTGKQTVVVSSGTLYYRNGTDFTIPFATAGALPVANRTTANQGATAGWNDPDGLNDGLNSIAQVGNGQSTVIAANRLFCKLGDPAVDGNIPAVDSIYTLTQLIVKCDSSLLTAGVGLAIITFEASTDNGVTWNPVGGAGSIEAGVGNINHGTVGPFMLGIGSSATAHVWIRLILTAQVSGTGTVTATVQVFNTAYLTDNFPVTWNTGQAPFSNQPAIFAPFRASQQGAPLTLFIASGGHMFQWDGGINSLTGGFSLLQLDLPPNVKQVPAATAVISYHTRMFAMTANPATINTAFPSETPKTIFWSKIGDATDFTTGDKTQGGSAVTDFLTGQHLAALEVIGSSLLMATLDSVMRFTGQSSDDIVISQNTEGVSSEVGAVGLLALKRFENVAAMLTNRGPYVVTEQAASPIGEQVLPDFDGLDSTNLDLSVLVYNRGRKEMLFAVPGINDGGVNKTIMPYAVRLQAWCGPWLYSFGISCMANYVTGNAEIENIIAGCTDGFVRLMDVGTKDDMLFDGSGGSNITMTVEEPPFHFGDPGVTKALRQTKLQAKLPLGHNFKVLTSADGGAEDVGTFVDTTFDGTLRDYRVDIDGQGKRIRVHFTDDSAVQPQLNGFVMQAYDMQRP